MKNYGRSECKRGIQPSTSNVSNKMTGEFKGKNRFCLAGNHLRELFCNGIQYAGQNENKYHIGLMCL